MFDQLFTSQRTIDHHSNSPLLEERLRYLAHCAGQGSSRSSLRLIAQHLLVFVEHFDLEAEHDVDLEQIQKAANVWVGSRPQANGMTDCRYGRMRFISDAKKWLAFLDRLRLPAVSVRPYTRLIDEFCDHLSHDCVFHECRSRISPHAGPTFHSVSVQDFMACRSKTTRAGELCPKVLDASIVVEVQDNGRCI